MPIARSLFELQKIDNAMLRLQREKSKLDDGSALRANVSTLQSAITEQEENLDASNRARISAEGELATRDAKIKTQQTRLMTAKTSHEIASLQRDIEGITKSRGELDEAILVAMDESEITSKKLDELRAQLNATSTQLAEVEANFASETARMNSELKAAAIERNASAAKLDADDLETYAEVAKKHNGVAVAEYQNGNCSVCGMMITPYNLKEAKTEEWPVCESCTRLLYVEAA